MVLYIVGIGIVLGFVALLWRQHKTSAGWQREASFLMDIVALSATALVVGVLVITQLGSIEQIASGSANVSNSSEAVIVGQTPTKVSVEPTLESEEASETIEAEAEIEVADEEPEATLEVEETIEPTSEVEASGTPSATRTTQATKKATPTASAKATQKVTSTASPKATQTAKATNTETPTSTATPSVYTIKNGDVFSVIAKQFDLSLEELAAANPNVNPERLTVGDELIIPLPQEDDATADEVTGTPTPTLSATETAAPTATIAPRTYVIQGGDTLSQIAERFDVTMDAILRANPTINAESLKLDAEIIIPPPTPDNNSSSTSGSNQYTVREGDTFGLIADRFGLTQQELQNANPNVNPDRLSIGQVIRIP